MIELIALVCALIVVIWTPIEAGKVASGWVRPKFKGTPEEFRARYLKQLSMLTWVGFVLGPANLALGLFASDNQTALVVKLIGGALWIGVGVVNLIYRNKLRATMAAAPPVNQQ